MTAARLLAAVAALVCLTAPPPLDAQGPGTTTTTAAGPQVIGARSFSPMVENVDRAMAFYKLLGLTPNAPGPDGTYPWSTEQWHLDLHGGQVPDSPMRFTYATLPGFAAPALQPLLVEPVEHKDVNRRSSVVGLQDPGVTTLVLLVRDVDAAARKLPSLARQPIRTVTAYGGQARAMTTLVPGSHVVELLQLDPIPTSTAPDDAAVLGGWTRVAVDDLDQTLRLYRDSFGLQFRVSQPTDLSFGGLVGTPGAKLRLATTVLPVTGMRLEFLEVTGVGRRPLNPRIQDPGAVRLQLTVRNIETALRMLADAGPSTVVSTKGQIITQPGYRVVVVSDLNGLFLVLTDSGGAPRPE